MEEKLLQLVTLYIENLVWLIENEKIESDTFEVSIKNLHEVLKEYD